MKNNLLKNAALFLSGILVLSGCVGADLKRKYPDIKTYAIEAQRPDVEIAFSGTPVIARIDSLSAASIVQDAFFDYRVDDVRYETDFYNQTIVPPAEMVTTQLREWMKASPIVQFVLVKSDSGAKPFYVIDGTLLDLYGDYRNENDPQAIVKLECLISRYDTGKTTLLSQKTYVQTVRLNRISPEVLAKAWNRGLSAIFQEIEDDLAKTVQETEKNTN